MNYTSPKHASKLKQTLQRCKPTSPTTLHPGHSRTSSPCELRTQVIAQAKPMLQQHFLSAEQAMLVADSQRS